MRKTIAALLAAAGFFLTLSGPYWRGRSMCRDGTGAFGLRQAPHRGAGPGG